MLRYVEAPDGVAIACETSGEGPPVVLVHGAGSARWSFDGVRPHLERRFTVITMDRRGRGDSADGREYALAREFEDVAAVVRDAGHEAMLVGHSYGGLVAAGAAAQLDLPRLALYEPAMGGSLVSADTIERWEHLIEADDRDAVLREFFREIADYGEEEIGELEARPCGRRGGASSRPFRASCVRSSPTPSTPTPSRRSALPRSCSSAARAPGGRCARSKRTSTRSPGPSASSSTAMGTAPT
jgi:pimeloyl-ACP methyl ester carboxylesterase